MRKDFTDTLRLLGKASSHKELSAQEQKDFDALMKDARMHEVFEHIDDEDYLARHIARYTRFSEDRGYKRFIHRWKSYRRRRYSWRALAAACIMVPVLAVSAYLYQNYFVRQVETAGNGVRLVLADGSVVKLDSNGNATYDQSGAHVKVSGSQLSYSGSSSEDADATNELIVPYGHTIHLTLSDGTRVWVNAGSRIKYPVQFAKRSRNVTVKGEAFFDVRHDGRPFIVSTMLGDVKVLGTTFDVNAYRSNEVLTTLVSGRVQYTAQNGTKTILSPGEQAVAKANGSVGKRRVNIEEYTRYYAALCSYAAHMLEDDMAAEDLFRTCSFTFGKTRRSSARSMYSLIISTALRTTVP